MLEAKPELPTWLPFLSLLCPRPEALVIWAWVQSSWNNFSPTTNGPLPWRSHSYWESPPYQGNRDLERLAPPGTWGWELRATDSWLLSLSLSLVYVCVCVSPAHLFWANARKWWISAALNHNIKNVCFLSWGSWDLTWGIPGPFILGKLVLEKAHFKWTCVKQESPFLVNGKN